MDEEEKAIIDTLKKIDFDKPLPNSNKTIKTEFEQNEKICNIIENLNPYSNSKYNSRRLKALFDYGFYFNIYENLKNLVCYYYIEFKPFDLLKKNSFLTFAEEYLQPFFKLNFENFKIEDYPRCLSLYKNNKNSNNKKLNNEELNKKEKSIIYNKLTEFKKNLKNVNLSNEEDLSSPKFGTEKSFVELFLDEYYSKNKNEQPKFSSIFNLDKNLKVFVLPSKRFYYDEKLDKKSYLEIINKFKTDEFKEYFDFFNFAKQELSKFDKDFYSNITKKFYKPEQFSKMNLLLNFIKLIETISVFADENDLETVNNLIERNSIIFKQYDYFNPYFDNETIFNFLSNNSIHYENFYNYNLFSLTNQLYNILYLKIKTENKKLLLNFLNPTSDLLDIYNKNLEIDKPFAKSLFENNPSSFIEKVKFVSSAFLEEEKDFIQTNIFEKAQNTKNKDERDYLFNLINEIDKRRIDNINYLQDLYNRNYRNTFQFKNEIYEFFYKNLTSISNKEIKEILNSKTKQNLDITDLLKLCSLLKAELNEKLSKKQAKKDYLSKNFEKYLNQIDNLVDNFEEVEKLKSFDNFFKSMKKEEFAKEIKVKTQLDFIKRTSFDYEKDYNKFIENILNENNYAKFLNQFSTEKDLPKFDEKLFNEVCASSLLNDDIKNSFASGEYYYRIGKNNKNENQTKKVDFTPLGINFLKGGEQFLCACLDYIKQSKKIHLTTKFEMGNKTDFQNIFDESKKTDWVGTSISLNYLKQIFDMTLNENSVFENVIKNVKLAFKNFTEIRNPLAHKENLYKISSLDDAKERTYALIVTLLSVCKIVKEL